MVLTVQTLLKNQKAVARLRKRNKSLPPVKLKICKEQVILEVKQVLGVELVVGLVAEVAKEASPLEEASQVVVVDQEVVDQEEVDQEVVGHQGSLKKVRSSIQPNMISPRV